MSSDPFSSPRTAIVIAALLSACSGTEAQQTVGSGTQTGGAGAVNTQTGGTSTVATGGTSSAVTTVAAGGVGVGGSAAGGASSVVATGGAATGGRSASGTTATGGKSSIGSIGGAATGGKSSTGSTGGAATGGKSSTGSTGGAATGGKSSTGSTGGAATGGAGTGGTSNSGGAATGGARTGGTSHSGGAATGGAGTGGTGTGGSTSGCAATGFHTSNGKVYDNHCNEFIMRGVNYPYAWYTDNTQARFADIASTKANSIRVVLSISRWSPATSATAVSNIISYAKANKLVALLEVHDCTGYGDDSAALNPDTCVAYWLKSDMVSALKGNEAYVMINIANEAFGNNSSTQWASFYQTNVPKFRTAGLKHTLIVDAPNWAQDWENTMRDGTGATSIFNADPDKNVIFSTHMYDIFNSASTVTTYFSKFLAKGLPFLIGEFASDHGAKGDVDDATIMAQCKQLGVGYLGWSWSGNSSDLVSLDITKDFNVSSLTTWGSALINGTNGIKATATTCTCFQ